MPPTAAVGVADLSRSVSSLFLIFFSSSNRGAATLAVDARSAAVEGNSAADSRGAGATHGEVQEGSATSSSAGYRSRQISLDFGSEAKALSGAV